VKVKLAHQRMTRSSPQAPESCAKKTMIELFQSWTAQAGCAIVTR